MAASRGDHARILPGTLVNNRYEVGVEMGRGNFSVVYAAKDKQENNTLVALKFVKKEYAHDAKFEHDILKAIRDANPAGSEKVLLMLDHFVYNRHPCFVLAPKGCPLKARRLGVREGHVSRSELRALTKQMCEALSFLHFKMKLVHTDLKPENILLDHNLPTGAKGLSDGFTIVDFGSASFYRMDRLDSDLISTRPYRSPEVVLGNGWYYPADTWSLGCILYEVYTGQKLFDVSDDSAHLSQMIARFGPMPKVFTHDSQNSRRFFDGNGNVLRGGATAMTCRGSPYMRLVAEELRDDPAFADLILGMLAFEPSRRIRCDDALRHPFIVGDVLAPAAIRKSTSPPMLGTAPPPSVALKQPLGAISANTVVRTSSLPTNPIAPLMSNADKENIVRVAAVPTMKPLYNNMRLNPSSANNTPAGPLSARLPLGSSHHHNHAGVGGRPSSLISPAAPMGGGASAASSVASARSISSNPYSVASSTLSNPYALEDRMNALKRTKADPSQMPVAGRASGLQYVSRAW